MQAQADEQKKEEEHEEDERIAEITRLKRLAKAKKLRDAAAKAAALIRIAGVPRSSLERQLDALDSEEVRLFADVGSFWTDFAWF